jgi:autotransporter-associated beta strand protein
MTHITRLFDRASLALALLAAVVTTARAQTNGTWIGTASANWSVATNWLGGTIPDAGGTATFNNLTGQTGAVTVTLDTTRTLSQIIYDTGYSFTIASSAGQTLNMVAGGLTLNSINSIRSSPSTFYTTANTISAVISGTGDLVKTGTGNVALTGANTFTGTVRVNQGALWINGGDGALGNAANAVELNGGILGVNTAGGFTSNRTFTIGANGGTFQTFTQLTLGTGSTLTGSGTLVKQITNGTLVIGGNASGFTGRLQIEGGVTTTGGVTIQNAAALGGTADVDLGGILTLDNVGTNTNNRLNGRPVVSRGGTFIVNGNASAATTESVGTLTLAQGNLYVTLTPNAAQATTLTVADISRQNKATLFVRGTNLGNAAGANVGNLVVTQNLGSQLIGGGGDPTTSTTASILPWAYANVSGTATNGSSFVTQIAGGQIVPLSLTGGYATALTVGTTSQDNVNLTASTAVTSATTINALRLAPTAAITVSGTAPLTITSGAILNTSTAATAPAVTVSAPLTAGSQELVVISTNGTAGSTGLILSGAISGTGGLTRTGNGAVAITGANTYTGPTTLAGGITTVGTTTVTADGSAPSAFGQDTSAINIIGSGGGVTNRLWTTGALVINRDLNMVLGGSTVTGLGTAGLSANESVVVNGNVTLNSTTGSLTNGFLYLEGGSVRTQAVTINGNISGTGGLRANFGNYAILNGNNSYSGSTIIGVSIPAQTGSGTAVQQAGEMWEAGSNTAFGTGTIFWQSAAGANNLPAVGTILAGGAPRTLANDLVLVSGVANVAGNNPLTFTGNVMLNGSATNTSVITIGANSPTTMSGVLSRGGLVKNGPGTLTLTGANVYSGLTTIRGGVLSVSTIGNGGVAGNLGQGLPAAAYLTLTGNTTNPAENGTLRYTGGGESTDRLFTVGGAGGTIDASGSGALRFTNTGSISSGSVFGTFTGITLAVGQFVIPGFATTTISSLVVGTVVANDNFPVGTTITEIGPTYVRLSNASTNLASVTGQTLTFTNPPAGLANRVLTLTGTNTELNSIAGAIQNNALFPTAVAKTGTGTWQLTGANVYGGGTTISGGTLVVNNTAGSGTGTGAVAVNAGGTLAGGNTTATSGIISGNITVNAGGRIAPGTPGVTNGIGTLSAGGNVTVNGGTNSIWSVPLVAVAPNTPATAEAGGANVSQLRLTGAGGLLNLVASTASPITIAVANPTGSSFTIGSPVSYVIGTVATAGNIQSNGGAFTFDPTAYTFTTNGFQAEAFSLSVQNTSLVLTFTPVPEPGLILGAGAVVLGLVGGARRLRRA